MARYHHAYAFDRIGYLKRLDGLWHDARDARDRALRRAAAQAQLANPAHPALSDFRYDPEWLDPGDEWTGQLLMLAMIPFLRPVRSLSSRSALGHVELMEWAGTSTSRHRAAKRLVMGGSLDALIGQSRWAADLQDFPHLDQHGGWLPADALEELRAFLTPRGDSAPVADALRMIDETRGADLLVTFED